MNNISVFRFILLIIQLQFFAISAQTKKIDSFKLEIGRAKHDTTKARLLNQLCLELKNKNPDTALIVANSALKLTAANNFLPGIAWSLANIGMIEKKKCNYDPAIEAYKKAAECYKKLAEQKPEDKEKYIKKQAAQTGNIGLSYSEKSDFVNALKYSLQACSLAESVGDKNSLAINLLNTGVTFSRQNNFAKAEEYLLKAYNVFTELGDTYRAGIILSNVSNIYVNEKKLDKAHESLRKALALAEQNKDKEFAAFVKCNIGIVYHTEKKYDEALQYFNESLKLREGSHDLNAVAVLYENFGSLYKDLKKYSDAERYLKMGLELDEKIGSLENQQYKHNLLYITYKEWGKAEKALDHYTKYIQLRDSLTSRDNFKKQTEMEMQYTFDRKQAEQKAEQEKKDAITAQQINQQKRERTFFIIGLVLVIALLLVTLRSFIINRRANKLLREKNMLIERQKEQVEEKQKEVLDSIYYASRIQKALITSEAYIDKKLKELHARK